MEKTEPSLSRRASITASRAARLADVCTNTIRNWREGGWFPENGWQEVRTSARRVIYIYDPDAVLWVASEIDRRRKEQDALRVPPHVLRAKRNARGTFTREAFSD